MRKFMRLLAMMGFGGAGMFILGCVFSISMVAIGGLVVLFVCTVGVVMCTAIGGYNPVEQ